MFLKQPYVMSKTDRKHVNPVQPCSTCLTQNPSTTRVLSVVYGYIRSLEFALVTLEAVLAPGQLNRCSHLMLPDLCKQY